MAVSYGRVMLCLGQLTSYGWATYYRCAIASCEGIEGVTVTDGKLFHDMLQIVLDMLRDMPVSYSEFASYVRIL